MKTQGEPDVPAAEEIGARRLLDQIVATLVEVREILGPTTVNDRVNRALNNANRLILALKAERTSPQAAEPEMSKSMVRRLATQMGWTPPQAAEAPEKRDLDDGCCVECGQP